MRRGFAAAVVVLLFIGACGGGGATSQETPATRSAGTTEVPSPADTSSAAQSPPPSSPPSSMGTSAEPQMVGDHRELELRFTNDGTKLAGTMFLPRATGRFPAIVWVHADGKHERLGYGSIVKAVLGGNMAFFTYDKRGVGESEGDCCPADARDAGIPEFTEQAHDALAALEAVRASAEIDADHVGLLGVSQAGWIVPIAAAESPDVTFTVLASGPTVTTGEENFYSQLTGDADVIDESARAGLSRQLAAHGPDGFDPRPYLEKQHAPGLWLFGTADGSIPVPESVAVLDGLKAEGHDFAYVTFPGAGHGLLDVDPPPPPEVIPTIVEWAQNVSR